MGRKMKVAQDNSFDQSESELSEDTLLVDTDYGSFIRIGKTFVLASEIVAVGPTREVLATDTDGTSVLLSENASGIDFLTDKEKSVEEIMLLICEAGTYEDDVAPGDE